MQWNLIRIRKEAGLTQKEIANVLGISVTTYVNKESGDYQFKSDEMFALRDYFNIPIEDIFLPYNCNVVAISEKREIL